MNSTLGYAVDVTSTLTVSGAELFCDEADTSAAGAGYELSTGAGTRAMAYAKEAHEDLFAHRRGVWDCGDGVSCLFDNDANAHCSVEIETLRTLLTNAGCTEVELATYHAAGHGDATHTLAMLVRGDARTILSVYETVDRQLCAARAPQAC